MRVYLEAIEILSSDQALVVSIASEAEFVRLDITGKTQAEEQAILTALQDLMAGLSCLYRKHYCYHDEDKPCSAEIAI